MTLGQIRKAKTIVSDEIRMREYVFRGDPVKREKKVKEMKYVYTVLAECETLCQDPQGRFTDVEEGS